MGETHPRLLACAALIAVGLCGWGSAGVPKSDDREIAFLRLTDGFWQLWLMAADGSAPRQMTRSRVDKVHAAWRPGRGELLYHTNRGETFVVDIDGAGERRMLEGLSVTDAAWSPDGKRLAYGLPPDDLAGGRTSLWISGLDGKDRKRVSGGGKIDALSPQWLGEGELLFRRCLRRDNMEVFHEFSRSRLDADAELRVEGDDETLKFDQAASSAGWLAYSSARSGTYEIWTLPLGGGTPRRVTSLHSYAGNPTWAPGGDVLAFDSDQDGTLQVYRIRADGQGLERLTAGGPSRKPVWRPAPRAQRPAGPSAAASVASQPAPAPGAQASSPGRGLAISWVSTDRVSFDPSRRERVSVRFQVSQPASVSVRFLAPDGEAVRTLRKEAAKAGDEVVAWDGRGEGGNPVAPGAYAYTIEARDGSKAAVVYDLRGQTGGEPVWALDTRVDPGTGDVGYVLPQASRVRVILSRQDTTWPIRTLLDWEPREAGSRREAWDGWDEARVVNALQTPHLIPIVYAFSLPKNVVIVSGSRPRGMERVDVHRRAAAQREEIATHADVSERRSLHFHARHPRGRCYDPRISVFVNGSKAGDGVLTLTEPTPFRFEIAAEQPVGKGAPIPRVSVFVFVDQVLVERFLVGYAPFHWIADPQRLGLGEHLITALLSWRDDHYGIAHLRVRAGSERQASRNESR